MGLTIHYKLRTQLTEASDIRTLVESLRQLARDLPFKEVGDLLEFQGQDADSESSDSDDEHRWLEDPGGQLRGTRMTVAIRSPLHIIGFSTWPGEGCESANLGFCQYPAFVSVPSSSGRDKRLATHLSGWSWASFCKTQYASDPECGGVQNFIRCHLCIVKLLDFAKSTGLVTVEVQDEGGYWDERDAEKLACEVGQWNEFIAAFAGMLKDGAGKEGMQVEAAIAGFPNFEHLEARGLASLAKLPPGTTSRLTESLGDLCRRRRTNSDEAGCTVRLISEK